MRSAVTRASIGAGDGEQEGVAVEGLQLDVGQRRDGRRPRHRAHQRDLAEGVAALELAQLAPVLADGQPTPFDDVEAVADIALPDDIAAACVEHRYQRAGGRFQRRRRHRARRAAGSEAVGSPSVGTRMRPSARPSRNQATTAPIGSTAAIDGKGRRQADPLDEDGGQDGADGETGHGEALDEPEDASQDLIRHDALEQGPAGDVDESKADAADDHQAAAAAVADWAT